MDRRRGLPLVHLAGTPYQQGVRHGQALRAEIARNLRFYFGCFERLAGLTPAEVRRRARRLASGLGSDAYADGVRGIAEGGGFRLEDVLALNVRYELVYDALGARALAAGCSTVVVQPGASADGHLRLAQTWDWLVGARGALQRTEEPSGLRTASLTEPGIFGGKIGLSSRGLGLGVNGLLSTDDDWRLPGRPFHVACYCALRADDIDTATSELAAGQRLGSANFVLAQTPDRVVDVETAPRSSRCLTPIDGVLVHTNHFLDPSALGVTQPPMADWFTCERYERLSELTRGRPLSGADLERILADHASDTGSICSHPNPLDPPDERTMTVAAAVLDLTAGTMAVSDGPPCTGPYQVVPVAAD